MTGRPTNRLKLDQQSSRLKPDRQVPRRKTCQRTSWRMTDRPTRRRLLRWVGAGPVAVLAGCTGGGDGETPEPIPAAYRTATAQGGDPRDPDQLAAKAVVDYQAEPNGDQRCAGCRFFVPDRDGDGLGACTIVEGTIDPDGWCSSYAPQE